MRNNRFIVVDGKKYKTSPLPEGPKKDNLIKNLMKARRDVGKALREKDKDLERRARNRVHKNKKLLKER